MEVEATKPSQIMDNSKVNGTSHESMRHNLPQIPSLIGANHRTAVSKASAKEQCSPAKQLPVFKSIEDIEKVITEVTPTKDGEGTKPPSCMPTPPSDGTPSEDSPKVKDSITNACDVADTTPAIKDITQDKMLDNSEILGSNEILENETVPQKKTVRAKTKGDIKKQLMKKKGKKSDDERLDDSSTCSTDSAGTSKISKEAVQAEGCKYVVADMFWAKVGGHPWWPCMIAYDPFDSVYFRVMGMRTKPSYHVQFFGQEGERGWIPESRMTPFEGKDEHLKWLEKTRKESSKSKKKDYEPPNKSRRRAWDIACLEATEAFNVDRNERRARFTLSYSPVKSKDKTSQAPTAKVNKKTKRKLSVDNDPDVKYSPPKKKRKRTKSSSLSPSNKDSDKLANQKLTRFTVYCSKKRDAVRREHPTFADVQIEKVLKEQWDQLPDEQKQKFIPMGSDVKNVSQLLPGDNTQEGSKRTPKPSKKKIEAEEIGGIVKHRKSSSGMAKRRLSSSSTFTKQSPYPRNLVDETIDSVAAGAGEIPTLEAMDLNDYDEMNSLVNDVDLEGKVKDSGNDTDDSCSVASIKGENKTRLKPKGILLEDGSMFEPEICNLIANPTIKKEKVCVLCEEQPGDMIQCDGQCNGSFHVSCLGLKSTPSGQFKCDECTTGQHTCFVCKKIDADLKRCTASCCGKFYHMECIKKFKLTTVENGRLICPLHTCATCAADENKTQKACKGKLYRCVRCPTAYHVGDFCIAAGSMNLGGYSIVCSRHFTPIKTQSHHAHVNVSWCFSCSEGGSLLCCETCPASFHVDCLTIDQPDGAWYCQDCSSGKKPLYGDIVWVKIGSYRWWPGEVCHPRNVPTNIQEKSHQVGEFPVRFFGSRDYFWLHQARVFLFQEGDKGSKENASAKSLSKTFQKAQKEGAIAYKLWKEVQEKREEKQQEIIERKPAPYKHIKTNQPVGSVTIYKADPSEVPRCECHPAMDNPCGDYSDCINRMTLEECHPAVCPAGDRCLNQRFQKREYPESVAFKVEGRGWGLKALKDIKKGQFVNEYVGDLIDDDEAKRRFKQAEVDNISNFYMLTLDTKRIIDAGPKGNLSRFMNHSCSPNCGSQKWTINGDVRVGLFALTDITAGSELTFNYNLDALGNEKKKCSCGAPTCSGFLGVKAKKEEPLEKPKLKIKKKKKMQKKVADDECYRCGDGGELIVCDRGSCTKVYHLKCLKLTKLPHGKWLCPWHHCDDCGKPAIKLCSECPNSFCPHHIEGNIFLLPDNKLVCSDHEDILAAVEASKLENEPNAAIKLLTSSSEATSTCSSSPNYSDSEVSASESAMPEQMETSLVLGDSTAIPGEVRAESKVIPVKKLGQKKKFESQPEDVLESTLKLILSPPTEKSMEDNIATQLPIVSTKINGQKVDEGVDASNKMKTPISSDNKKRGRRSSVKNSSSKNETQPESENKSLKPIQAPVFDDTDSDECNLVMDIP